MKKQSSAEASHVSKLQTADETTDNWTDLSYILDFFPKGRGKKHMIIRVVLFNSLSPHVEVL